MSIRKRAILYLIRKKSRTILLAVLMFVMSCFIMIGFSLKSSADIEADRLRKSLGTGFILKADTANKTYYEDREGESYSYKIYAGPRVTDEMVHKILTIKGVEDYKINYVDIAWVNLNLKPGAWTNREESDGFTNEQLAVDRQSTYILPCRKGELDANFRTGALTISQGRNIQERDHFKAVISDELAQRNNLALGDHIQVAIKEGIVRPSNDPSKTWGEPIELEIVGLFHANFEQAVSDFTYENGYVVNQIYTDMDTHVKLEEILGDPSHVTDSYLDAAFFVEDPAELDSIMQQIREREDIDVGGLIFKADDTAYRASVRPFRLISVFSSILLFAGTAGLGVILYLVMSLWVKGRKHEAGILLSVGIGKAKIVGQMVAECLMVSAVSLVLCMLLSGIMIDKCAGIAENVTSPKTGGQAYTVEINTSFEPVVTKTSSENVKLDHRVSGDTVLWMVIAVCGVSCISVILSAVKILDIEPKKLLQSM